MHQIIFAPDYRGANPYQTLLADALRARGLQVQFLSEYRRGLPLWRGLRRAEGAILHLHWPEHYFKIASGLHRQFRRKRYPLDLALTQKRHPLVVTAHNLKGHGTNGVIDPLIAFTFRRAGVVIAHSERAKELISSKAKLPLTKIRVIPHGDLLDALPPLPPQEESRVKLGLRLDCKYALMFGRVERYKGIDEVVDYWRAARPAAHLIIAGECSDEAYLTELQSRITGPCPNMTLTPTKQSDLELSDLLGAVDCALFNYPSILTSGSAVLARSAGIPVLLPERLWTVDLGEPSPMVFRFRTLDQEFTRLLDRAINSPRNPETANAWRFATRWSFIAEQTDKIYLEVANG
jgi:beta-1,4-mannosyltransferase